MKNGHPEKVVVCFGGVWRGGKWACRRKMACGVWGVLLLRKSLRNGLDGNGRGFKNAMLQGCPPGTNTGKFFTCYLQTRDMDMDENNTTRDIASNRRN